jgi:undecaprenyl-diphosphatase
MIASIIACDHRLFWLINSNHTWFFDQFFFITSFFGTGWVVAPILLAAIFFRVPSGKRGSLIALFTLVVSASGLINSQIKHIFHTPRPPAVFSGQGGAPSDIVHSGGSNSVHVVGEKLTQNSFPSGHTNTAVTTAILIMLCFGRRFWPALFIACLVGYSRVYLGAHFPSDVIGGGLLGIIVGASGFIIFTWIEGRKSNGQMTKSIL